jgi:nucleoside-diphosphate-sugar epimerase
MNLSDQIKNIAIFGANGHIAKNLIHQFSNNTKHKLFLFSTNKSNLQSFVSTISTDKNILYTSYENLHSQSFDIIINCIGISNPPDLESRGNEILVLSKKYDDVIIEYLKKYSSCQYFNFSSGIVHGSFSQPPHDESLSNLISNDLLHNAYYLTKIYLEKKHRSLSSLNIIDIRIFSFFSRFINLNTDFFISKIIKSINNNEEFFTNKQNFFRDFIHPKDLFQLINLCTKNPKLNFAIDAYSRSSISKYDILEEFSNHYNLKYSFKDNLKINEPTEFKKYYYSLSRKAKNIGYTPIYPSLETLLDESALLIKP